MKRLNPKTEKLKVESLKSKGQSLKFLRIKVEVSTRKGLLNPMNSL